MAIANTYKYTYYIIYVYNHLMYVLSAMGRKKYKITAVQTAFSFVGTINANNRQNIVPPKEHAVGTVVIVDFISP